MRARHEIAIVVGALLALQALVGFGAVALLARVAPAIGVILRDNDASLAAAEAMLAVLALPTIDAAARQRFDERLAFATQNVTVAGERAAIQTLQVERSAALDGDLAARKRAVGALIELGRLNRLAMQAAEIEARQLAWSGAWAMALLGLLGVAVALGANRRLQRRLVLPIDELDATLAAAIDGDVLRRCHIVDAPRELIAVRNAVNALLDRDPTAAHSELRGHDATERAALLAALDDMASPCWIVGYDGAILADNAPAAAALDAEPSLRPALAAAARGEGRAGWTLRPLHAAGLGVGVRVTIAATEASAPSREAADAHQP